MPIRYTPLATGEFYHVFNRGITNQSTFTSRREYQQALLGFSYYRFNNPPLKLSSFKELSSEEKEILFNNLIGKNELLVDILCFVLMPNHFHLLLKQVHNEGISIFLSKFTNSYTRYFNTKNNRKGPLFQGVFKALHITNDEQLIHLSRYIHLNPLVSYAVREEDFLSYPWSSLPEYLYGSKKIVNSQIVLSQFGSVKEYRKFLLDQVDYGKRLEQLKHLTAE